MRINSSIFRSYDIRGSFPDEINERAAYLIGCAFAKFLGEKAEKLVVGRDNRASSPGLKEAVVKAFKESGKEVIDIGLASSPLFYFAVAHYGYGGGIQITGSHLAPGFNGLKIVKEGAVGLGKHSGLSKIKEIIGEDGLNWSAKKEGRVTKKDPLPDYVDFNLRDFDTKDLGRFKVVVDTGNSVPGKVVPAFFEKTDLQLFHLFKELDSNFPNRPLNPLEEEALAPTVKKVKKEKADLGAVFDGDGDRIIFVDERGEVVASDLITAFVGSDFVSSGVGKKVVFGINSSKVIADSVKESGGQPVLSKVGHTNVKRKMKKVGAVLGGEVSGHFFLRDHYFSEAPFFVLFKILEAMSDTGKPLSRLLAPFSSRYFYSGEINFEIENKKEVLEGLAREYEEGKTSRLDGVRVDFPHWWFNARPSRTEDLLRLVVEADTKELLQKKRQEITKIIKEVKA